MSESKKLIVNQLRNEADYEEKHNSKLCLIEREGYSFLIYPEEARAFADDIEREYIPRKEAEDEKRQIIEAQKDSAHHIMKLYAESINKPMDDGDNITKWLDRWFIPRPRFEDGEPVRFGKNNIKWESVNNYPHKEYWNFTALSLDGRPAATAFEEIIAYAEMTEDGFVKRRIEPVLDADGVEIKPGDIVYSIVDGAEEQVKDVYYNEEHSGCFHSEDYVIGFAANMFTHKQPNNVNKILDDMKSYSSEHFMPDSDTKKAINGWIERIAELKLA